LCHCRRMRIRLVILAATVAVATSACASEEPSVPTGDLLRKYIRSSELKKDRFPSPGAGTEDRMANLTSRYGIDQFPAVLSADVSVR
jgi:hypothetical protein